MRRKAALPAAGQGSCGLCYAIQIATKKYIPLIYWLAVTAVAIFGTLDSTLIFLGIVLIVLIGLVASLYYRQAKARQAGEVPVAAAS